MKSIPPDMHFYDTPELEETEFALAVAPCRRIEDSNDIGDVGDSFSIGSIAADALVSEFDWE